MPRAVPASRFSQTARQQGGNGTITVAQEPDDKQLELYLIGALPEDETERFDEMSLTDDAFAERLRNVENDLVDAYARGELSGALNEGFRQHYLASPRRREKVRFAGALVSFHAASDPVRAQAELAGEAASGAAGPADRPRVRRAGPRRAVWLFAMAASVLLVLGYLGLENRQLQRQMDQAKQERTALVEREEELSRALADDGVEAARKASELAEVRERIAQLERELASKAGSRIEDRAHPGLVAFSLAPPTRGVTSIPVLKMKEGAGVALTLELEADDFSGYEATLKDSGAGHAIWKSGSLKPRANNQKRVISLRLRPGVLKQGIYNVELGGLQKGGGREIVGNYPFKVVIQ